MNRDVQYLIQHSIFQQDAFGIPADDLPTSCQSYKQPVTIVSLTASKLSSKESLVKRQQQIWWEKLHVLSMYPNQREGATVLLYELRQVDTQEATVQVPHSECTRYTSQHIARLSHVGAKSFLIPTTEFKGCFSKVGGRMYQQIWRQKKARKQRKTLSWHYSERAQRQSSLDVKRTEK